MWIKRVVLENYCGFRTRYSIDLLPFTVLVGPNNGGKTTALRAIKFATDAFRLFFGDGREPNINAIQQPQWVLDLPRAAQRLAIDDLDQFYFGRKREAAAAVSVLFEDKTEDLWLDVACAPGSNHIHITLRNETTSAQYAGNSSGETIAVVRRLYDIQAQFIPPVGTVSPFENELPWEQLQAQIGVGRYAETWRNQLHWQTDGQAPEMFQSVAALVRQYIPDVELRPPRRTKEHSPPHVVVDYREGGTSLDIAAGGGGLRSLVTLAATLQLVPVPILLFDEPDAHLHSSLQRRVAAFLSEFVVSGKQVIVSTHAPDFIDEVPLECLRWVDRAAANAAPCDDIGKTLVRLGAVSQSQAIQSLGADTVIYFEDNPDRAALTGIMTRCGRQHLVQRVRPARLKGFGDIEHVPGALRILQSLLPMKVAVAAILDADYLQPDPKLEVDRSIEGLLVAKLPCKELENLLLFDGKAIMTAANQAAESRTDALGVSQPCPSLEEIESKIDECTKSAEIRAAIRPNWIVRWGQLNGGFNDGGQFQLAEGAFETRWADDRWRRRCCSGKAVLRLIRQWLQAEPWKLTITNPRLFAAFTPDTDLLQLFDMLEEHITNVTGRPSTS